MYSHQTAKILLSSGMNYQGIMQRIYGKYNEIKNLIFQKCDNIISESGKSDKIISPKKSFIIPAVFLANSELEFRKDLIKFHPEFLILYSYCCESLTEFDKKEILKNLLNEYSYRIPNIISAFSDRAKAFSFFVKDFDIEYIVNKLQRTEYSGFRDDKYFFILMLYYSDIKSLDNKLKGKVNSLMTAYLFSKKDKKDKTINIDSLAVEILLRLEYPKVHQKLKIFLSSNISKLSEVTIATLLKYLCPEYISFKETTILMKKYICNNVEMAYPDLIKKLSDASEIKSILDNISFDFSNENEVFIYVSLFIRLIDCGGKPDEISNYLLKLHKYFVSNSKHEEKLEQLKDKIPPEINSAFVKNFYKSMRS